MDALLRRHETISAVAALPTDNLSRAQRVLVLGTCLMTMVTVELWLRQQRGSRCCDDVEALRDAISADLEEQFGPGPEYPGVCLAVSEQFGYQCAAFPDERSAYDTGLAALIQAAIALPVHIVLQKLFQLANAQEEEERWLLWSWPRTLLFGRIRWLWTDPSVSPSALQKMIARNPDPPLTVMCRAWVETMGGAINTVAEFLGRRRTAPEEPGAAYEAR